MRLLIIRPRLGRRTRDARSSSYHPGVREKGSVGLVPPWSRDDGNDEEKGGSH